MTTGPTDERRAAIAAVKAERERDKVEATREYQAERLAVQANLARLRLARQSAQATAAADEPAKKKPAGRPPTRTPT